MVFRSHTTRHRVPLVARRVRDGAGSHRTPLVATALCAGLLVPLPVAPQTAPAGSDGAGATGGITVVEGIRVGHFTYPDAPTGCTVVITDGTAVGGVDVRGGAPGTVETDLLDPVNTVERVDAVFLAGGSAYGLGARRGVMRYLEENGQGYPIPGLGVVPIVSGAIIFDLRVSGGVRPGPDCGYRAATAAGADPVAEGSVGAGAGATVGKMRGMAWAMKGGTGTSSVTLESGLVVGALAVVNAVGDVVDPRTGDVIAGARTEDGGFADARRIVRGEAPSPREGENTTTVVVATNALLTKAQATKVAQMAHDGLARAIVPSHTPSDGDTVFSLATGALAEGFSVGQVGALAAEVVAEAVVRAVRTARGLPSIPAVRDLPADEG
ncbi:MAG: P1 family peptidase [Gemmatimonadota bacterium]|nr:P1 family peptidase [Gemmatimonadota bacterium]MDE2871811.1 P1 family peptidase [Gemmatimonadota bacterium]